MIQSKQNKEQGANDAKGFGLSQKCGTYDLATVEDDLPRVRPFGTVHRFEDKLYIRTGKKKDVSRQLHANPHVELCACDGTKWIRVTAVAVCDERVEAQASPLAAYPELGGMYRAEDGNTEVWYLDRAVSVICSFTEAPVTETF